MRRIFVTRLNCWTEAKQPQEQSSDFLIVSAMVGAIVLVAVGSALSLRNDLYLLGFALRGYVVGICCRERVEQPPAEPGGPESVEPESGEWIIRQVHDWREQSNCSVRTYEWKALSI